MDLKKEKSKCSKCLTEGSAINKIIFDCVEKVFVHSTCLTKGNAWRDDCVIGYKTNRT